MASLAAPLQIAAVAGAVGWPLAAGAALVYWSRLRAAAHARKVAALEAGLQGLYEDVKGKPVPSRLSMVVDALEEADKLKPASTPAKGRSKPRTPAKP